MSDKEVDVMDAPPPEVGFDVLVLGCLPVDPRGLPAVAGGVEIRKATVTDKLAHCINAKCRRAVWMSEEQRYLSAAFAPGKVVVLCYLCAVSISDVEYPFHGLPEGRSG